MTTPVEEHPIISDIRALRDEERDSDPPLSSYAYAKAVDVVSYVNAILSEGLPRAFIAPDGSGGIRIEWIHGSRSVRVLIPAKPEKPVFIYERNGRDSDVHSFSQETVVEVLRSMILT